MCQAPAPWLFPQAQLKTTLRQWSSIGQPHENRVPGKPSVQQAQLIIAVLSPLSGLAQLEMNRPGRKFTELIHGALISAVFTPRLSETLSVGVEQTTWPLPINRLARPRPCLVRGRDKLRLHTTHRQSPLSLWEGGVACLKPSPHRLLLCSSCFLLCKRGLFVLLLLLRFTQWSIVSQNQ